VDQSYVLDRSDRELDRLDLQGIIYRDITRRALAGCGIEKGMRVLDVGCGSGDVSRLAAELVGASGSVLGVDIDGDSLRSARHRTAQTGATNVVFQEGEATSIAGDRSFDALVGRFFLMHQTSPGETLAAAAKAVRPGGVVMMMESHMAGLVDAQHSLPDSPIYDEIIRWKCQVVAAAGADLEAGLSLYRTFREANLPAPDMRMEAPVEGGPESLIYRYMAESVRSMLAMASVRSIEGFTHERVEALEADLRDSVVAHDGVLVCWPTVSAWCRLPGTE
jgi:ubiquinone/menaquinone biosynthesis C-methylase UbiE